jgi:hypothetical protein
VNNTILKQLEGKIISAASEIIAFLKDVFNSDEELKCVHEISGEAEKETENGTRIIYKSKLLILTSKKLIKLNLDDEVITGKFYFLKDIFSFEIIKEFGRSEFVRSPNSIKKLRIEFANGQNLEIETDPKTQWATGIKEQKANAYNLFKEISETVS